MPTTRSSLGDSRLGRTAEPSVASGLALLIRGTAYACRILPPAPRLGIHRLIRLQKRGGLVPYHVAEFAEGDIRCDCADYEFRHLGAATVCKHIQALIDEHLLLNPNAQTLEPVPAFQG